MNQPYSNTTVEAPMSRDAGIYPYNRVERSLSGHQFETDDTIGAERIKRMHTSGTYEEWDASGGSTKVIHGRDYTLVMDGKDLIVHGSVNIVVNGDCNTTVSGDYNVTVGGDYNLSVAGTSRRRINGNDLTETTGDYAYNTGSSYKLVVEDDMISRVKGDSDVQINGAANTVIGTSNTFTCNGDSTQSVYGTSVLFSTGSFSISSAGSFVVSSLLPQSFSALNFNFTGLITATDVISTLNPVTLATHMHPTAAAGSPSPPIPFT